MPNLETPQAQGNSAKCCQREDGVLGSRRNNNQRAIPRKTEKSNSSGQQATGKEVRLSRFDLGQLDRDPGACTASAVVP